jgi:DNA-binding NarL/FixJ family response regulator
MQIVVADDHPMYLEAVSLTLHRALPDASIHLVSSIAELLDAVCTVEGPVDLALLDLSMAGMDDGNAISLVRDALPDAKIVLMSGVATLEHVKRALGLGAKGFLSKTMRPDHFAQAVNMVLQGGTYIPADLLEVGSAVTSGMAPAATAQAPAAAVGSTLRALTERELAVLQMLPEGLMNKEIARELGLAEMTVKLHVRQILRKLNAKNRAEAAVIAQRAGLRTRVP